jgi:arginase
MRDLQLIINPSEITAGTRGASLGPDAVITAARKKESHFFRDHPPMRVRDVNRMLDYKWKYEWAKRIEGFVHIFSRVANTVEATLNDGKFPYILASDHGSAGGTIAGIKAAHPEKRLGVIWIDAHADLHTPYTTPSGNMHGMPLATAFGIDNDESQHRRTPHKNVVNYWNRLKGGKEFSKLQPKDLVFIAVRDTEDEEKYLLRKHKITNHTVEDVRKEGVATIVRESLDQLKDCDIIYVSFDVDSMDPKLTSRGTGTPVDNGLSPQEAKEMLLAFGKQEKLVCMEFVEVNPCLDDKINKMAEVTFELFEATAEAIKK